MIKRKIESLSVTSRCLVAVCIELLYMAFARYAAHIGGSSLAQIELLRTPVRLVAALLFYLLLKDVITSRPMNSRSARSAVFVAAALLALATPVLIGGYDVSVMDKIILAVTSLPVALNEELFFRGILQNVLMKRLGSIFGFAATLALFTLYHTGVITGDVFGFAQVVIMGLILGLIYLGTGSMMMAVGIHTLYDALDSLPRLFPAPERIWGLATLLPAAALIVWWNLRLDAKRK